MTYIITGWGPVSKTVPITGHVVTQREKQLLRQDREGAKPTETVVTPRALKNVLTNDLGCEQVRQKGSHVILKRRDENGIIRTGVIPMHDEPLSAKLLRSIMKQLKLDFNNDVKKYL